MCDSKAEGGQRCKDIPSREPAHRSVAGKAKRRQEKYKGPKDTPCTDCGGAGFVKVARKDEPKRYDNHFCKPCDGVGYLNDASGRTRTSSRRRAA